MVAPQRSRSEPLSWWIVGSIGVHGLVVAAAVGGTSWQKAAVVDSVYVVDLEPPNKGTLQGEVHGKGTPLPTRPSMPVAKANPAEPREPKERSAKTLPRDPEGVGPPPVASIEKGTKESAAEHREEELREAVRKAMLAPEESTQPSPVEGSGTAAPEGDPRGVSGGKGKAKLGAAYSAVLGGWFASRLHCQGLNLPWEEMKSLNARASISITPDRKISNFSVSGSGNATYDSCVQGMLQSLVSQGITLPESPEGDDPPPSMTLNFHCRNKDQCS